MLRRLVVCGHAHPSSWAAAAAAHWTGSQPAAAASLAPPSSPQHQRWQSSFTSRASMSAAAPAADGLQHQQQLLDSLAHRPPIIFYHHPCPDGVFAALAAHQFYHTRQQQQQQQQQQQLQQQAVVPRFVPHEVYQPLALDSLNLQPDSVAFLLDYAGPDGFAQALAQRVAAVVILDHHKSAAQQLATAAAASPGGAHPPNMHVLMDMQRSGAALARDFFRPQGLSEAVQHMFRLVEDADLWRWALPDSQAFHAGLAAQRLEYHAGRNPGIWDALQRLDLPAVLAQGRQVMLEQDRLIVGAVAQAVPYQLGGQQGLAQGWGKALGCAVSGDLVLYRSKLGNRLAQRSKEQGLCPVGIIAYTEPDMPNKQANIKVSLRSVDGFDTTPITAAFGGGGHAAAGSCILPRTTLQAWQQLAASCS